MTAPRSYTRVLLAARPEGAPRLADFAVDTVPVPQPGPGEVLLKTLYLSLDPYMRGRMSAARSYAKGVEPGDVMVGGTVSEVVASNRDELKPGDIVLAYSGWQEFAVSQ